MKTRLLFPSNRGFTLVEVMVVAGLTALIGGIAFYVLNAGSILYAKNFSMNASGSALRAGLDRIGAEVSQATDIPQLITLGPSGTFTLSTTLPTTGTPVGPAAGVIFDKYLGGPYVMESTGTVASTSFSMKRSTDPLVVSPIPSSGDVVQIDGCAAGTRSLVNTVVPGTITGGLQSLAVSLGGGSTAGIGWTATAKKTATLVRKVAFIIVSNELRFYPDMENATDYTTANYVVVGNTVGTAVGEETPFSLILKNDQVFLSVSFRVQNQEFNKMLANKESMQQNTFFQINTLLRPRNAP